MGVGGGAACILGLYMTSRGVEVKKAKEPHPQEMASRMDSKETDTFSHRETTTFEVIRTRDSGQVIKYVGNDPVIRDNLESIVDNILESGCGRRTAEGRATSPSRAAVKGRYKREC